MAQCGMCGREDTLKKANVEGTILNVCMNCMKYGTTVKTPKEQRLFKRRTSQREEITDAVVLNAAQLVKQAREKKNTKQIELAKEIAEKESIIQKIESGSFHPKFKLSKEIRESITHQTY